VAADVEEGATVAEAVLEVGKIVTDAVEGAEPLDEAGGDLLARCPMVGANCRGILVTVVMGMA
jgi:hypothetical protein